MIKRIPEEIVEEGRLCSEVIYNAAIRSRMGGLGGCKEFNLEDFPERFHDLVEAYINDDICSVELIYIAMERERMRNSDE